MEIPLARFCSFGLPFRELDCISYPGRCPLCEHGKRRGCEPYCGRGSPKPIKSCCVHVTRRTLKNRNRAGSLASQARTLSVPCSAARQTLSAWRVAATSCARMICTPCATPASAAAMEPGTRSRGIGHVGDVVDQLLARGAEQHRHAERVIERQRRHHGDVVVQVLAEADAGIGDDLRPRDAGRLAGGDALSR